ncbi:hypothetical protein WJX73_001495 [Symbiochloris irregularis]|uniref:Kinesin motor domain-containing protein n=1 Tax=Symbiochloris irregularis TaxID=706552 RepID=A0AAW1P0S3_9CHLO
MRAPSANPGMVLDEVGAFDSTGNVNVHSAYRSGGKVTPSPPSASSQGQPAPGSQKSTNVGASRKSGVFKWSKAPSEGGNSASESPKKGARNEFNANLRDSAVKVAVVVRPRLASEKQTKECVTVADAATVVVAARQNAAATDLANNSESSFQMDRAYHLNTVEVERQLFDELVQPIVDRVLTGFNGTVFAYGQTGSGKTFTMGTAASAAHMKTPKNHVGVIPRVVSSIFSGLPELKTRYSVSIWVEYVEIYADEIRDLLRSSDTPRAGTLVAIRESPARGTYIEGAERRSVQSEADVGDALEDGNARRAVGVHNLNEASSRSHALFTLHVEQRLLPTAPLGAGCHRFLRTKLHLVDLAGSERAKETGASGQTFSEGVQINKGLSALGNVISALTEVKRRPHIPYRDSKLTRLLQDSLGGNSETLMLACVGPTIPARDQTLNTLRYAARARNIHNHVGVTKYSADEEIAALRAALAEREAFIGQLQQQLATASPGATPMTGPQKLQQRVPNAKVAAPPNAKAGTPPPSSHGRNSRPGSSGNSTLSRASPAFR